MNQDNDLFYKDIEDAFELLDKKREGVHYLKILEHLNISPYYSKLDQEKLKSKLRDTTAKTFLLHLGKMTC